MEMENTLAFDGMNRAVGGDPLGGVDSGLCGAPYLKSLERTYAKRLFPQPLAPYSSVARRRLCRRPNRIRGRRYRRVQRAVIGRERQLARLLQNSVSQSRTMARYKFNYMHDQSKNLNVQLLLATNECRLLYAKSIELVLLSNTQRCIVLNLRRYYIVYQLQRIKFLSAIL